MAQNTFLIGILLVTVQAQQQFQPEPYLIFANSFDIRKLNFDGTNYRRLVEGLLNVVALDYDYASGYIYWSDHLTRKIQRAEIDNAQNTVEDFVVDDIEVPDGIAVDWKNRKLFFTDRIRSVIEKIGLDGTNRIVLITTNIYEPRGIALDPHSDWFYFTDVYDAQPTIQKARMSDGSQQTTIISTGLAKPNAITVDYIDRMIYWADATTDKVESCDLNGNARQVLVDNPSTFHPYGLTQYDDRIYWTDQQLHHIVNLNKHDKNDKVIITGYFSYPTAIHVVHPDRQLGTEIDSCQHNDGRGECDHICIDLYGSYMCACRQGYHLQTDEHTCDDTNECSINNGGCSHHCLNIESSFFCTCINGYTLQADQRTCRDTNECHISNGGCQFSCHNTDSSYYCSCPSGYTLESNKITCHDIDECVTGSNPCPSNALCQNVPGSYQCICGSGFHFNKVTRQCEDTNECTSANNMCSQRCVNTGGSFRCECNIGYTLQEDGSTCIDINECNVANDCQQQCTNILGSYVCSCTVGSILNADGKSCRPTTCQPPPPRPGFTITCQETSHLYLSRCDIDCDLGTLVGSNSITCLSNSEWSILTAECIGISGKTENDPPIATYLTSNVIPEDADNGDIVGYLRSIDSDPMQTFTYFLRDDADPFYIGSHDTLRTRGMLDFETMTQYTVSILATDDGIPPESLISSLIVYVINVNEPPGQPMWQQTTISENANVGDVVTLLNALDPDEGQQLNFTLITNSNGKFSMVNNALVVNRPLDYETNRHHQIHIQVRDNGMPIQTNSAVFELDIIDENEPPLKINFIGSDVPEFTAGGDTVTGKVIGRFETEDPDQGDTHTYSLDTLNACFDIQGSDLLVGNVDCFNYETHPFYLLSVQASDSGGLSVRTTIRIGIIDVNEPPTGVTLSTNTIMEHVPLNTVVGTLTALDEDTADTHIFTLLNSNGLFAIEGHTVKVAADLNYETFPTGVGFEVRCIDSDSNSITVSMMVFLGNENEEPNDISVVINKPCSFGHVGPNGVIIDACIPETTAPNDLVALVAASDPDGDTLSITMIDSSGKFMLTDNLRIQLGPEKLNYESDSYGHIFQVTLISSDPNGLTKEKDLYFEIEDVNDVPTGVTSSSHIVSSATPQGQNFAVLTCMDEDINNVHTFTLIDDSGGRFTIFQNHLQVAQPLDVSVTHTRTIIVKCSDGMAESLPIQIDIQVTASIGNADIDISLNAHTVDENKPANTFVGLFTARSNAYPSDSFTFDLLDSDNGAFVLQLVGSSSANLLTNRLLNYEDEASHSITVQANGQHGMAVKTFMVTVTDVNEPPTYLSLHNTVVQENINNALVGIVTAQDPEGDAIDFEITQDPTGSFQLLTTGTPNTKRLVTTRALDYESELSLTVAIRAKEILDDTKTSESVVFAVNVIDVNEAPNMIRLDRNTISETATSGDIVGPLMITDPDSAHYLQHFTCILRDDANGIFGMNGLNLVVADHAVLDYEGVANHELTVDVECQDQRKLSHKETLTVIVTDVNERPTDIKSASGLFKVKENQNVGEVVAYLITEDPDNTHQDSFTYTVSPMDSMAIMSDQLITHRQLNFEEKSTHEVTLTVTDEGGLTLTKVVTVEVVDTNDPPTAIVIPTGTAVYENSPTDTLVAELATIDEDIGQSYTYTLESHQPRGSLKLVDGNKLMIDDGSIVNYETVQFLEATIITTDNGTPSPLNFVETLQIPILDVNEPPRSMTLASNKVVENPVDRALVGEIYVDDPDSFQQSFMCGLTSDEGNRFELEHNGSTIRLLVGNGLLFDYEAATYHDIIIDCHDTDHQSPVSGSFRILILNANDKPSGVFVIDADPDDTTIDPNRPEEDEDIFGNVVTASIATVKEDASPGLGIVAYVFVTDEDNLNDDSQRQTHSCELISEWEYNNSTAEDQLSERRRRRRQISNTEQPPSMGSDEIPTQFMIQSGTNSIVVREVLDYEENNEYLIYLRCRDNGNPSMSVVSSVKIIVLDVDEAPLDIGLSTLTMLENSPEDTLVAHIGLVDPDGTMTAHAYEIISLGVPYYIKDKELRVSRTPIDHEITPVWTVQIRVQEVNTDLEIVKNFDITIDNVNEPPDSLIINGDTSVVVMETADVNSEVGTLESHDPDELDTEFGFAFYGDHPSHDYFNIIDDKLLIKQQLDAWEMDMHELTIEVTDSGGLSYIGKITLRLTAVNRCNESDYCSVYAQCIHSVCTCMPGFMGNGFTCTDIDNCDPNPCHPDNTIGDCQDGFGGLRNFTCNCKMGWLGPDCYREVNDCFNNSCNSLGTSKCVDKLNDYVCECKSGYTGQYCEVNIDDCLTNECLNGGQCIDGINGYICDCKEPYQGINCDTDASICYDVSCPHNGTCIPYSHGKNYACRCLEPFSPDCEGCMYGYGGDNCQPCKQPLTGVNCEVDGSVCVPNPCFGDSVCVPYRGGKFTCICPGNYTGSHCEYLNGIKLESTKDYSYDNGVPFLLIYILLGVVAVIVLFFLLICIVWTKRRRVLSQKKTSSRAKVRYDSNQEKVEMGMDFQNMQEIQGAEVHELENPTFFDFEEMTSPGGASAVLQEQEEQARTQMASIANRPIQNPKNNIVSVKVTNDLRADFNKHGARPRMANSAEQPSIVTDGRRMKMTSSKNNLGNFENKEVGFEEEDNLKKELFVSLNNESVMYQNPSYDTVDGAQSAQPMNALQTEQKNNQGNETNKKKTSVKELAMKFQSPGVRSSQQEFKNNPVYESDDEAQDDVHD